MIKKLISVPQAAKILGMSRIAILKKIYGFQLPAFKVGRNYVIEEGVVLEHKQKLELQKIKIR